jgi:glycosyltransferase involved in cell wall biosynthesis
MTRLSVIIPCYRQAHLVGDAIRSVLGVADQILVIDDGSPDDVAAAVAPFGDAIALIRQANAGLSGARNAGLAKATGEYCLLLDADDWMLPGGVQTLLDGGAANPDAAVLYAGWQEVDPEGQILRHCTPEDITADPFHGLLPHNVASCHAQIARTDAMRAAGGFDTRLRSHEDWDLWLRLAASGAKFQRVNGEVAAYRQTPASMSRNISGMRESAIIVLAKQRHTHNRCETCRRVLGEHLAFLRDDYVRHLYREARTARGPRLAALSRFARTARVDPALWGVAIRLIFSRGRPR